jgi:hypothetical protein
MNHLESIQHYATGFEDGKRQAEADKASTALMRTLFSLFFKMVSLIILFCPGILCANLILEGLRHYTRILTGWNYGWVFITIVYVLECLVFFLKGWSIALQKQNNGVWIIPWLICGFYCFALPVFMLHTFLYSLLKPVPGHPTNTVNMISWVVAGIMGIYIYSRYHLQSDTAPRLMGWAYRIGKGV